MSGQDLAIGCCSNARPNAVLGHRCNLTTSLCPAEYALQALTWGMQQAIRPTGNMLSCRCPNDIECKFTYVLCSLMTLRGQGL